MSTLTPDSGTTMLHADHLMTGSVGDAMHLMIENKNAFLMAMGEGSRIEIHAADAAKTSWTQLSQSAEVGSRTLQLDAATGWQPGDVIAVASTSRDWEQAEERTIIEVSDDGKTVVLDAPLEHFHSGMQKTYDNGKTGDEYQEWTLDARAEVGLLSRNVTIQGDADSMGDGYGGTTMVMDGASMHISGAEFDQMGQEGILGSYPVHWHMLGDASGQYVSDSSIHDSFNKGITIHGTHNAWLEDNVVFNTTGHGYFLEDGSETGNVLKGNLAFGQSASASIEEASQPTDATHVSSYWITNPNNHLWGNHAAGSEEHGIFYSYEDQVNGHSAMSGLYDGYVPGAERAGLNLDNTAHTNGFSNLWLAGDTRDDGTFDKNSFSHEVNPDGAFYEMHVEGFTAYNSGNRSIFSKDSGGLFERLVSSDNFSDFFGLSGSVTKDSLFIGEAGINAAGSTDNFTQVGYAWYDQGQSIIDSHFAGYTGDDRAFGVKHGSNMGGRNTVEGVTFDENMDSANTYSHNNIYDADPFGGTHGIAVQVVDVDGSITGQAGVTLTSMIDNDVSRGFQSGPGSVLNEDWSVWINDGDLDFARFRFGWGANNSETREWEIIRSDGQQITMGSDSDAVSEVMLLAGTDLTYTVRFTGEQMDSYLPRITDLQEGSEVQVTFEGVPKDAVVRFADEVAGQAALDAADGTAFYRDGSNIVMKFVGTDYETLPADPSVLHPEASSWHDTAWIDLTGTTDLLPKGDYIRKAKPPVDEVSKNALPEQAASTSRTTVTDGSETRWSDASSWDHGKPDANSIVVIQAGEQVLLDENVTVKGIIIDGGELIAEDVQDLSLSADWILVIGGGLFQVGTEEVPHVHDFVLTLEGDDPELDIDVASYLSGINPDTVFLVEAVEPVTMPTDMDHEPAPDEPTPDEPAPAPAPQEPAPVDDVVQDTTTPEVAVPDADELALDDPAFDQPAPVDDVVQDTTTPDASVPDADSSTDQTPVEPIPAPVEEPAAPQDDPTDADAETSGKMGKAHGLHDKPMKGPKQTKSGVKGDEDSSDADDESDQDDESDDGFFASIFSAFKNIFSAIMSIFGGGKSDAAESDILDTSHAAHDPNAVTLSDFIPVTEILSEDPSDFEEEEDIQDLDIL